MSTMSTVPSRSSCGAFVLHYDRVNFAIQLGRLAEQRDELLTERRAPVRSGPLARIGHGREVGAMLREGRREQLGVPTGARRDVEDGHRRSETEELQRVRRVTVLIASHRSRKTMRPLHRRLDRRPTVGIVSLHERARIRVHRGRPSDRTRVATYRRDRRGLLRMMKRCLSGRHRTASKDRKEDQSRCARTGEPHSPYHDAPRRSRASQRGAAHRLADLTLPLSSR
jgi:hypothetical protein